MNQTRKPLILQAGVLKLAIILVLGTIGFFIQRNKHIETPQSLAAKDAYQIGDTIEHPDYTLRVISVRNGEVNPNLILKDNTIPFVITVEVINTSAKAFTILNTSSYLVDSSNQERQIYILQENIPLLKGTLEPKESLIASVVFEVPIQGDLFYYFNHSVFDKETLKIKVR